MQLLFALFEKLEPGHILSVFGNLAEASLSLTMGFVATAVGPKTQKRNILRAKSNEKHKAHFFCLVVIK